ncbi:MAG: hypothetical protein HYS37_11170 [Candidatus Rokubacteria bacterium]|nr:hypothetical protein [Candidatus Rokubacteria bacterium]
MPPDGPGGLLVREESPLFAALAGLARDARLVFFAGLPGTGKSLLIHQLAHLAQARGRRIHLLQWDVARPVFEASGPGRRYPLEHGVTHGVIRLAVGRWARAALARWHAERPGLADLLIGETPFVGHRLVELARPERDEAEPVLAAAWTRFVIPVPSRELRAHLEAERARRAGAPLHEREREDAPPDVLRDVWRELVRAARALGVAAPALRWDDDVPYDPVLYRRVYQRLLGHRHAQALPMDTRLPAGGVSPYDFRVPTADLVPTETEAARAIQDVETRCADPAAVQREVDGWYLGMSPSPGTLIMSGDSATKGGERVAKGKNMQKEKKKPKQKKK